MTAKAGPRLRRILGRALLAGLVLLAVLGIYEVVTWPDVAALAEKAPKSTAFMDRYRAERTREGKKPVDPDYRWVPYRRISRHLARAVLVSEDIGFFDHRGFATEELRAAVRDALEDGKAMRGASTISQQLAKNLWLSPSRNPWRKVKEAILTVQLERSLPKRRILELYLNVVEMGPGTYGAEAAARRYFGKAAADLSEREAAALAAGLPSPRRWHPGADSSVARRRAERIAGRMAKAAWLERLL